MRTTITIPVYLHRRIRHIAKQAGVSLPTVVESLVEAFESMNPENKLPTKVGMNRNRLPSLNKTQRDLYRGYDGERYDAYIQGINKTWSYLRKAIKAESRQQ